MWYRTHKRGWRFMRGLPPSQMYFPLSELFCIEHWSYFILSCLVLDIEGATPWYVITMSWPNVPYAKLPP